MNFVVSIKKWLKGYSFIYNANAFLKAWHEKRRLRCIRRRYEAVINSQHDSYSESSALKLFREKIKTRGIVLNSDPAEGELEIFWVGAHYEQDASGFLQSLRRFGNVSTFVNADDGYGLLWPTTSKTKGISFEEVRKENSRLLLEQVVKRQAQKPIHILMGQMWGDILDCVVLEKIQQLGIITVNVSMDDRLPNLWGVRHGVRMGAVGLARGTDLVLTTSPEVCPWYWAEKCPAVFWPLASDPSIFYPREDKKYDVVFVGGRYGIRGDLINGLLRRGIKVDAFGPGWPNGFVRAEKISELFGSAKIILGTGWVGYHKDIMTIKLRDFDAPMSGALYLTNRNPDLEALFREGVEIECFDSIDECADKINFYLAHPRERSAIADAGLKKACNQHTWDERFKRLFEMIGLVR